MSARRPVARGAQARPRTDPAAVLLAALEKAGATGCTKGRLQLTAQGAPAVARRALLEEWLLAGRVVRTGERAAGRYFLPAHAPSEATVAARLREIAGPALSQGPVPLWRQPDLNRKLTVAERPLLVAAIKLLEAADEILTVVHRKSRFFVFSAHLESRLARATPREAIAPAAAAVAPPEEVVDERSALLAAYARLVNESGGFPDVRIDRLRQELRWPAAALETLLVALWREGRAALSLGDWSLANDETRAAAVRLDGESYLLVRLE